MASPESCGGRTNPCRSGCGVGMCGPEGVEVVRRRYVRPEIISIQRTQGNSGTNTGGCAQMNEISEHRDHARFHAAVEKLCSHSERFRFQQDRAESWWWHLVYMSAEHVGSFDGDEASYWGDLLASATLKSIAGALFGDVPEGLRSSLRKLRSHPLPNEYYGKLVALLRDPACAKHLLHQKEISVDLIDVISGLPPQCLSTSILGAVKTAGQAYAMRYVLDCVFSFVPLEGRDRVWRSARSITKYGQIQKWFEMWLRVAPYPAPPWNGNELVRPIRSTGELLRIARQFENCLGHYVYQCVVGEIVFYRWAAGEPVVIALRREPFLGWVVVRMEGRKHSRHVACAVRKEIISQFSVQGFRMRPPYDSLDFEPFIVEI